MYMLNEEPPELAALLTRERELADKLFSHLPIARESVKISSLTDIYQQEDLKGNVLRIVEGNAQCTYDDRVQYILEEGDSLGYERCLADTGHLSYRTDFAIVVNCYSFDDLLATVQADSELLLLWNRFLATRMSIMRCVAASFQTEEVHFNPALLSFNEGDVLIEQGSIGDKVFTMAEGAADVFVDGVKVGEVLKDEMFGAIATLTDTPRTASVVATASCLILALPKEQFSDLIKNRPGTVQQLIENMARTIVDLNEQVVSLRSVTAP